ncbi:hypothetical protein V7O61_14365 [Methanolobus sp. WCC1]|uniref:hypothetical protein n=1 Tax=unclassified Methanolobus TaxID=2629569 RepID=UPI00324FA14B
MEGTVIIDTFTLNDKYLLLICSIVLLIGNIIFFLKINNIDKPQSFQIKNKRKGYSFLLIMFLICSFSCLLIAMPILNEKTLKNEDLLCEALVDNHNSLIVLHDVEDTYYPKYENWNISWYTVSVKDERYRHSEKVVGSYISESSTIYETENGSFFCIKRIAIPKEYRGNETFAYWYTNVFVLYNIVIACIFYPLFSLYKKQINFIWHVQSEVSTILIAILISSVLIF